MIHFRDLSIRKKLFLGIMGTSSIAVLAVCIAFYTFTINQYKEAYHKDIQSLTKVIAFNCQAALTFDIPEDAEKMLLALENRSSILAANIYDQQHNSVSARRPHLCCGSASMEAGIGKPVQG